MLTLFLKEYLTNTKDTSIRFVLQSTKTSQDALSEQIRMRTENVKGKVIKD